MFDLSNITLAFATASAHEEAFALMQSDMIAWHHAGEYPTNPELVLAIKLGMDHLSEGTCKVYASRILKWARSGKTPSTIRAVVNTDPAGAPKGKGGRPKGKGKGASTKPAEADAAPQVAAESRVDVREGAQVALQGMMAAKAKLVPPTMLAEFENALTTALMILRAAKPE